MSSRRPSALALAAALLLLGLFSPASFAPTLRAAPIEHDLQQGLAYLRTGDLATDLAAVEKNLAAHPVLVLDLRHALSDTDSAATLRRLLSRAPSAAPSARFILVSRHTDATLLKQFSNPLPGVVLLGPESAELKTDIPVATTPKEDDLAYEALTSGVALDKLLSGTTPQKARYDEASLVRAHANGNTRLESLEDPEADAASESTSEEPPAAAAKPPAQPVDRVLLRAVQLHRALRALKKL